MTTVRMAHSSGLRIVRKKLRNDHTKNGPELKAKERKKRQKHHTQLNRRIMKYCLNRAKYRWLLCISSITFEIKPNDKVKVKHFSDSNPNLHTRNIFLAEQREIFGRFFIIIRYSGGFFLVFFCLLM